jgi:phage N-6-adenine-methyltransferase
MVNTSGFFNKCKKLYNFTLDACADSTNAKCEDYITEEENGLFQNWITEGAVWCNPPYGKEIGLWVKKAYEESLKGQPVVMLVPARTCSKWWHDYAMKGNIDFLKGRLKFGDSKNAAPFPSALIIFTGFKK